jgi:hypothetical protein
MKIISERISILKKDDVLSIVILPTTDKKKLGMMFLWLLAWSVCGVVVFASYFQLQDRDSRLFVIIYLSFWLYFEYRIVSAYVWKRNGREKLWIRDGILHYQREINRKGKIREFNAELISGLRLLELDKTSFSDSFHQSFWVKGGERIAFDSQASEVRLGMQLTDEEARTVINEVNSWLKVYSGDSRIQG